MNILFLRSNPVKADSRIEKEINSLLKAGHTISVFAWDRESTHPVTTEKLAFENGEATIYRIGIYSPYGSGFKKTALPLAKFQLAIFDFIKKNRKKIDAVHSCDFDTGYFGAKACKMFNIKLVYDIFDYYVDTFDVPDRLKNVVRSLEHNVIDQADATIICSEKRIEQIEGSKPKKVCVIHNSPFDFQLNTENEYKLNAEKIKIVYVGSFVPKVRNTEALLDFARDHSDFELHIGGMGALEDTIKQYAEECDNIFFYGTLPYEKVLELESACDIITALYDPCIRNHYYAAPNKFYESLMLGKPVIMAKGTGMSEIVEREGIGVVVDFDKVDEGLIRIKDMKPQWDSLAQKARELYDNDYSWAEMEKRLIELYKEI